MNSDFGNNFQFSPELDHKFLAELFDGDIIYAETVFGDFLSNIPDYWKEVENAWETGDTALLKSSVHKCKTLFGYVGHTRILARLTTFENKCATVSSTAELEADYKQLNTEKIDALEMVQKEFERLHRANA
ncbi:MAG: hypothetical protein EOO02_15345 [Chitinophagaceae bacterium]|nr:MAG: hypothetical protein EOO02_15345 [Chitinophagaceae bacterium]